MSILPSDSASALSHSTPAPGTDAPAPSRPHAHAPARRSLLSAGILGLALGAPLAADSWAAEPHKKYDEKTEAAIARAMDLSVAFENVAKTVSPAVVHITANKGGVGDESRTADRARPRQRQQQPGQRSPFNDPNFDEMWRRFFGDQGGQGGQGGGGDDSARQPRVTAFGSGVIVSKEGYILTNNHVVEGANLVTVAVDGGQKYTAKVVGADPATDIAVIKIEGEGLPTADIGDSDALKVGEWVVAIGNPFELNQTVTAGIVSAKGRSQRGTSNGGLSEVQFQDFIQTDASINPGNSGGPLLNLRGEIVGINSAILTRTGGSIGIGFAIPSNMAKNVMDQLIASGKVERGFLGLIPQDLNDDLSKNFNYTGSSGALVSEVSDDTPAAAAGIKAGDIITKINGRAVAGAENLRNTVAQIAPGKQVDIDLVRDGKPMTLPVKLAARPTNVDANGDAAPVDADTATDEKFGATVQTLTPELAKKARDPRARQGVVITEIQPEGVAVTLGLRPGDIIVQINRVNIANAADFRNAVKDLDAQRRILLTVRRNGVAQFLSYSS